MHRIEISPDWLTNHARLDRATLWAWAQIACYRGLRRVSASVSYTAIPGAWL